MAPPVFDAMIERDGARSAGIAARVAAAALAAAALAGATPARACSVCGCGDPLLVSSDPAAMAGRLRLQLDAEYLRVDAANEEDPALTDRLTQSTVRLNAAYRPVPALSLSATVPLVTKDLRTTGAAGGAAEATGLGDVEVAARWVLWRAVRLGAGRVQELAVSAGTSAPTGPNDLRSGGERIDEHGQLGTGGWGPFAGVHWRFEQRDWTAFASLSGRVHSANSHQYAYGSALLWSAHGQRFVTRRFVLDVGVDGRWAAADELAGAPVPNTGGTVLAAAPGAYVEAIPGAWIFLRGQIPFVRDFRGRQDQLPSAVAGVQLELL